MEYRRLACAGRGRSTAGDGGQGRRTTCFGGGHRRSAWWTGGHARGQRAVVHDSSDADHDGRTGRDGGVVRTHGFGRQTRPTTEAGAQGQEPVKQVPPRSTKPRKSSSWPAMMMMMMIAGWLGGPTGPPTADRRDGSGRSRPRARRTTGRRRRPGPARMKAAILGVKNRLTVRAPTPAEGHEVSAGPSPDVVGNGGLPQPAAPDDSAVVGVRAARGDAATASGTSGRDLRHHDPARRGGAVLPFPGDPAWCRGSRAGPLPAADRGGPMGPVRRLPRGAGGGGRTFGPSCCARPAAASTSLRRRPTGGPAPGPRLVRAPAARRHSHQPARRPRRRPGHPGRAGRGAGKRLCAAGLPRVEPDAPGPGHRVEPGRLSHSVDHADRQRAGRHLWGAQHDGRLPD